MLDGHKFLGWYEDENFTKAAGEIEKGSFGKLVFYAKWECIHDYSYSVTTPAKVLDGGVGTYTCKHCNNSYTVAIPATRSIKILAIGNSFSVDALEHLYGILKDAGVEDITIANLYYGGCSLDSHWSFISTSSAQYTFYVSNPSTMRMVADATKRTAQYGINFAEWDIITVQQNSGNSGKPSSLGNLQNVIDFIKANAPDAKIYWHMTWAYASHYSGLSGYGNDQLTMYNAIIGTVNEKILNNPDIAGIIPSGTSIQNLRTSSLGNDLTRDGFHLSYGTGRYTAALTWLASLTGYDVNNIDWYPTYDSSKTSDIAANLPLIKEAVSNAMKTPLAVTKASGTVTPDIEPEKPLVNTTLSALTDEDRQYLISKGLDPDKYMLLDLTIHENYHYNSSGSSSLVLGSAETNNLQGRFLATQIFSRHELIAGSIIRINSGYQYRPEGWIALDQKNSARPGNVTVSHVVIDKAWWGDYNYRGFNISKTSGTITAADAVAFRIYVPVAKRAELTSEDRDYLTAMGLNPDEYMVLDYEYVYNTCYNSKSSSSLLTNNTANTNKFIGLQMLTRYDLTAGSVIRIDSGYQYRPEGWYNLNDKTTNDTRPSNVSTDKTVITAAWWGEYAYRGINFSKKSLAVIEESEISALRIYVKVITEDEV